MKEDEDDLPLKRAKGVKAMDQKLLEDVFENNEYVRDSTKQRSLYISMHNGEKPMTQAQERETLFKLVPKMAERADYPEIDQVPQSRDEPTAGVGPLPASSSTGRCSAGSSSGIEHPYGTECGHTVRSRGLHPRLWISEESNSRRAGQASTPEEAGPSRPPGG